VKTLGEILYSATEIGRYEDEPAEYRERCEKQAQAVAAHVLATMPPNKAEQPCCLEANANS